jgi:hypothetical protein
MAVRLAARTVKFFRRHFALTPEEAAIQRQLEDLPARLSAIEERNGELRERYWREYATAHIWPRVRFDSSLMPRIEQRAAGAEAPHGLPPAFDHMLALTCAALPALLLVYLVEDTREKIAEREAEAARAAAAAPAAARLEAGARETATAAGAAVPVELEVRLAALEAAAAAAAALQKGAGTSASAPSQSH